MIHPQLQDVVHHLRHLTGPQTAPAPSERELLDRFIAERDEAAFAALVERRAPMVLGVCRRVLRHAHDAEDACQATFRVLARKAASVRKRESLASWLHGVAYHVSTRLKRDLARRGAREALRPEATQADVAAEVSWRELRGLLEDELARLPARYRSPLILCYLEGKTRDEAAQQLGWSLTTFRGRLERGRERLRARLIRRGLTLSAALFAGALGESSASAAPPPAFVVLTVKAALLYAAGQVTPDVFAGRLHHGYSRGPLGHPPGARGSPHPPPPWLTPRARGLHRSAAALQRSAANTRRSTQSCTAGLSVMFRWFSQPRRTGEPGASRSTLSIRAAQPDPGRSGPAG
jgi:RNA polymerase sigma factor (sigma-70 family)